MYSKRYHLNCIHKVWGYLGNKLGGKEVIWNLDKLRNFATFGLKKVRRELSNNPVALFPGAYSLV